MLVEQIDVDIEVKRQIEEKGNQAYWHAVKRSVLAINDNDHWRIELWSKVAIELMQRGYHKHEKK